VPCLPALVWGRDERHTGEMWNSNSVTSWLLASAGIDLGRIQPPHRGRAPGWRSGLVVAARDADTRSRRAAGTPRESPSRPSRTWPWLGGTTRSSPARVRQRMMPRSVSRHKIHSPSLTTGVLPVPTDHLAARAQGDPIEVDDSASF
jgi:hypothetical protein